MKDGGYLAANFQIQAQNDIFDLENDPIIMKACLNF